MKEKLGRKEKKRFSMKFKIIILCLSCTLLAIASVSLTTLPGIIRELKESTESHMSDFIEAHSDKITNKVDEIQKQVDMFEHSASRLFESYYKAADMYGQQLSAQEQATLQEELVRYNAQVDTFKSEIERFTEGSAGVNSKIALTTAEGYVIISNDESLTGTTFSEEQIGTFSKVLDEMSVNATYDETAKTMKLTYQLPVYNNNVISGHVVCITDNKEIDTLLDDYTLTKIPAPRLYLLDKNGIPIAHTNDTSIGVKTTNPLLLPVLDEIRKGTYHIESAQTGYYLYQGKNVSVSYIYIPETDWILGVNALDSELYKDTNAFIRQYAISVIVILLLMGALLYFVASKFTRPIQRISAIVQKIGELDFTINIKDKEFVSITNRNDEIGDMGHAVEGMVTSVKDRIEEITQATDQVNGAAVQLLDITAEISEKADVTSVTTEELSAGMEETTATTDIISSDVKIIQKNVAEIKEQISNSTEFTLDIMKRAELMRESSIQAENNTRNTFEGIKERGAVALEQSKATVKINEFAKVIMDIADQTSLLALNASIEAARAGESGRGFAVVADEIGNLAQQSSDTVTKISDIVESVNEAVKNITECLSDSQSFVEESVYKDYEDILKILDNYNHDAGSLHNTMNDIDENTKTLYDIMENMTESIQGINQTMQEAAVGVSAIAEKNNSIGELTSKSNEMVTETNKMANQLEESVKAFKL